MRFVLISAMWMMGAIAPFTERGTTDFDTFLQILNPYGEWKDSGDGHWQFFPISERAYAPMTSGQWLYTDYGWYWQGTEPYSWACDHYGVWKRGANGSWGWSPDGMWQPFKVDFRMTKTHVGWRPSATNQMGEFVEKEEVRFAKPEEWVFVTNEKFKGPITPADVITGPEAAKLLEDSSPCDHTFVSWREMDRLGPDPVNFLPKERMRKVEDLKDNEPEVIAPVIWSLPTLWAKPPPDAKPDDLYVYRPKLFQDKDGIQRRILIWERPAERAAATQKVNQVLQTGGEVPIEPAVPAVSQDNPAAPTSPVVPLPTNAPAPPPVPTIPSGTDTSPSFNAPSLNSKKANPGSTKPQPSIP